MATLLLASSVGSAAPGPRALAAPHSTQATGAKGLATAKGPICFGVNLFNLIVTVWVSSHGVLSANCSPPPKQYRPAGGVNALTMRAIYAVAHDVGFWSLPRWPVPPKTKEKGPPTPDSIVTYLVIQIGKKVVNALDLNYMYELCNRNEGTRPPISSLDSQNTRFLELFSVLVATSGYCRIAWSQIQ